MSVYSRPLLKPFKLKKKENVPAKEVVFDLIESISFKPCHPYA